MWKAIKNDPILKTVTIIILGVIGFGFTFNIMFGPRNHGMGYNHGYTLQNSLSYMLVALFNLLLVVLVIAALIAVFRFISKCSNQSDHGKMFEAIKKDPVLKNATIIVLSVATLSLVIALLGGTIGSTGGNHGIYNNMMGSHTRGSSLLAAAGFLLELLLFISVISLIVSGFMYIRHNYYKQIIPCTGDVPKSYTEIPKAHTEIPELDQKAFSICAKCSAKVPDNNKFCPDCGAKVKPKCNDCGKELDDEWKCCPNCGLKVSTENAEENREVVSLIKSNNSEDI